MYNGMYCKDIFRQRSVAIKYVLHATWILRSAENGVHFLLRVHLPVPFGPEKCDLFREYTNYIILLGRE